MKVTFGYTIVERSGLTVPELSMDAEYSQGASAVSKLAMWKDIRQSVDKTIESLISAATSEDIGRVLHGSCRCYPHW